MHDFCDIFVTTSKAQHLFLCFCVKKTRLASVRIPVYHPFLNKPKGGGKKYGLESIQYHLTSDRLFISEILIGLYTETWTNVGFMGSNHSNR